MSRLWHLSITQLLAHFEQNYPQAVTAFLAAMNPEAAHAFRSDLRLATDACRAAVGTQRTNSHDNT
jgi:hypothetical protein